MSCTQHVHLCRAMKLFFAHFHKSSQCFTLGFAQQLARVNTTTPMNAILGTSVHRSNTMHKQYYVSGCWELILAGIKKASLQTYTTTDCEGLPIHAGLASLHTRVQHTSNTSQIFMKGDHPHPIATCPLCFMYVWCNEAFHISIAGQQHEPLTLHM